MSMNRCFFRVSFSLLSNSSSLGIFPACISALAFHNNDESKRLSIISNSLIVLADGNF
jgi:hypothetical protein